MGSDYYVTLTISRDKNESSDDVAFTCTSNQNKVLIDMIIQILVECNLKKTKEDISASNLLYKFQVGLFRPKVGGDMIPEKYAVNHIDKNSNEDFINCEFHLAESLKMQKQGLYLIVDINKNFGNSYKYIRNRRMKNIKRFVKTEIWYQGWTDNR